MILRAFKPLLIVVIIVLFIYVPELQLQESLPRPAAAASFTLNGRTLAPNGWGFTAAVNNPGPDILVSVGDSVTLTLLSADGVAHQFCVDYETTHDFICDTPTEPQSPSFSSPTIPVSYTFRASTTPGNYTYYCTFHTIRMFGKFAVAPPIPQGSAAASPNKPS